MSSTVSVGVNGVSGGAMMHAGGGLARGWDGGAAQPAVQAGARSVMAPALVTPEVWAMITSIAPVMKGSRLFGVATDEQAAVIMLKGFELGLSLTAAFEFVHVIDGKPSQAPRGALALILNSPLCEGVEIRDEVDRQGAPVGCAVTMKRRGGLSYTARFTLEDARRAGLLKDGSGWAKYPAQMCKWRAVGFAADVVFPDVLNGMKRADEFGADLTPDGAVIEGAWQPAPVTQLGPQPLTQPGAQPVVQPVAQPDPMVLLQELVERYGAEAIMRANGNRIPNTPAELVAVAVKLASGPEMGGLEAGSVEATA